MRHKQPQHCAVRGFAMLSMTLILVFIMTSASLSFAHIQQQRIQRNQLNLNYLKTRMMAANKLDLFYIDLYQSPELLVSAAPCSGLEFASLTAVPSEYMSSEQPYLCMEEEDHFKVSIALTYNDTERLVIQHQLITISMPWVWQPSSIYGV